MFQIRKLRQFVALLLAGIGLSVSLVACTGGGTTQSSAPSASPAGGSASGQPVELTFVSFAVTQAAYEKIIPLFTSKWKQEKNQDVTFNQSYGGSGSQTRAVIDGLEADVVALALALDTQKIEKAGLIQSGWEKELPNDSIVTKSVIALVTREGNPKNVKSWSDLTRSDVKVVTANPKTSGGARWNFLGLWGSVSPSGTDAKALEYTTNVYKNVPVLPKDAREATDVFFKQKQGDVLINYENEVLLAKQKGEELPFVIPDPNVSIDNPIAVVDTNVDKHGTREVAEAFVKFLYTPEAQREFAKTGFRSVDTSVAQEFSSQYPKVNKLLTVQDFGGWGTVQKDFFDDGSAFDKIQAQVGKA